MVIDHIFIISNDIGKEADDLVNFSFIEGSGRIHPGQGTINRKFYFANFFLEILWVVDEKEIQSEVTSITKLWERSQFFKNEYSPFGLCVANKSSTDKLFEKGEIYQPNYFPKGVLLDIITNEEYPKLPWTFRLPNIGEIKTHYEPIEHSNGINSLTQAEFEINIQTKENRFIIFFDGLENIGFKQSNRAHLTLEFDHKILNNNTILLFE